MNNETSTMQTLAWVFAAVFALLFIGYYIPFILSADGMLFGFLTVNAGVEHFMHLALAIWAGIAAWTSARASTYFFRAAAVIYAANLIFTTFTVGFSANAGLNILNVVLFLVAVYAGFMSNRALETRYAM